MDPCMCVDAMRDGTKVTGLSNCVEPRPVSGIITSVRMTHDGDPECVILTDDGETELAWPEDLAV